ncbi:Modification methylase FokI [Jeotgalicoccus saudimassiliensis]|uniref:Site-specific DNA-methyltransferase (adenine-specific) n=1 Tax=Jeotgalicoccus saudimassiliensis TaxID=1461582 RepID=A0A078M9Q1_9STAP|nr:DNA adenine methylase [Jeotgalicoccus saudimassiliensis]CEA02964.1 Modification methylase FokI [Jeotgalicoccus saudimassiliensis]
MPNTDMKYIKSCLNYTGGKHKLLKQIIPYFPDDINNFIDLFCGGANVAINIEAKETIYCIDKQEEVIRLFNTLKVLSKEEVFSAIEDIINKFGLTNTSLYGYHHYNCDSASGLSVYNKENYKKLRDYYNNKAENSFYFDLVFFVLTIFGFNNQIRFNKAGNYNIPVGKRDFNEKIKTNVTKFIEIIKKNDMIFRCEDFREMSIDLSQGDFLYADPPYLISTATYNEQNGWTETEEKELLNLLDELNAKGIKFALSNVLEHKGKENLILKNWAAKYYINYLDYNYRNSNYQIKEKTSNTSEVLITNYIK